MHKNKNTTNVLTIQKYTTSKSGTIIMLISLSLSFFIYIISLYILESDTITEPVSIILSIFKDILLAVLSIIGTSLLTTVFIEKNQKNVDYTELIANDIFASPEFYTNLTDSNKYKIHKYLEEYIYNQNPIKSEIYNKCREKIHNPNSRYYYSYFNMNVKYTQYDSYSQKDIQRVVKICSYDEKLTIDKLPLLTYNLSPTNLIKNFELVSVTIGTKKKPLIIGKDVIPEKTSTTDSLLGKCGYTDTYTVYLQNPITLHKNEELLITVDYISRVTDEDMSVGFGVSVPCQKFIFNFEAPPDMIVYAHTYSFLNPENHDPNSRNRNILSLHFDNWLLPGEGVAICISSNRSSDILNFHSTCIEQPSISAVTI